MTAALTIRNAVVEDLSRLTAIYNTYVRDSHATFDLDEFTVEQRREWFDHYESTGLHQLLVAESEGGLLGYASSSSFRAKPAYRTTVETTIYLAAAATGRRVGSALYTELLQRMDDAGAHRAVAAIALPNDASAALHRAHGFVDVGTLTEVGHKFGRWIDVQWFERTPRSTTSGSG